ncbi:MAG: aspartate--tRNA ligase [Fibrobacter sp.]|nr:aspartate--tRNA ligase [Fibrobacter sp.]
MKQELIWKRTHTCGELTAENEGNTVVLNGWVHNWRNHGGIIFIDLRDRAGITQVVFSPESEENATDDAVKLRHEYVVSITGVVRRRPDNMVNPKMATGSIEVYASKLMILNTAQTPPLHINDPDASESEELRYRYRYLDLRRPGLQYNIIFRHKVVAEVRKYLWNKGFTEIETPILMKSTPEGARDFLVPSRINKGKFYALPQSPQTYKQILMIAGFERYFQIARCFRDEDLRADRQPEFTQIDAELSFIDENDIYSIFEDMIKIVFKKCLDLEIKTPFPRMSFKNAFRTYGTDKPDLRFGLPIHDVTDIFKTTEFKVFKSIIGENGNIAAIAATGFADLTRKNIDKLTSFVSIFGAKGLVWLRLAENGVEGPAVKFLSKTEMDTLIEKTEAQKGDMIFIIAAAEKTCFTSLGQLRLELGRMRQLTSNDDYKFLWINEFPMFEFSEQEQKYAAVHHPFTSPVQEDIPLLETGDFHKVRSRAYDLVLNGFELGGGSIRIHQKELQQSVFKLLGISQKEAERKFSFLLNALTYGAPPHGGIAFGLDRIVMLMLGLESIRDTIAFPKTTAGISLMDNAPDTVSETQINELGIEIKKEYLKDGEKEKI